MQKERIIMAGWQKKTRSHQSWPPNNRSANMSSVNISTVQEKSEKNQTKRSKMYPSFHSLKLL